MHKLYCFILLFSSTLIISQNQILKDNFENNSIMDWYGDDCGIDNNYPNPFIGINNPSSKVLKYSDQGGLYSNIGLNTLGNFKFTLNRTFSLKIYVPSINITGNQTNQISLKLQNRTISNCWKTQCNIVKTILLDKWQIVTFNFAKDPYTNKDPNSKKPVERTDFNRVLLQVNGENNTDKVIAYIDDFNYDGKIEIPSPKFNRLVWSDEFEVDGAINAVKWHHQTKLPTKNSWFGNEQQHYTNRLENSFVKNGFLKIIAKKEIFKDQGVTKNYTSARLNSKFSFKHGRVEVRAKLPRGIGTFPAIWMLGKNINELGAYWQTKGYGKVKSPECGEIDIMEHWGKNQNYISSSVHHPIEGNLFEDIYSSHEQFKSNVSTVFHIYSVEWTSEKITLSMDGVVYLIYNPKIKNSYSWPFDKEMYILLNVAMKPDIDPKFKQSNMEIDYVRVYQEKEPKQQQKNRRL